MTIFSYPHPSACKHYISISLDFIMSECLILNISVWRTDSSFIKSSLDEFWLAVGTQFPTISEMASPLPFCTMCVCDDAFSALVITKSKYQSIQKTINNTLCLSVPNFQPRFNSLCKASTSTQGSSLLSFLINDKVMCISKNTFWNK